ncbi:putative nucleotide-diphospho-sugar transferase [Bradyrhizobium sp. 930_D9_N1_4]|uniref:putative nucleotide-diphospho-sugar transferase n=1 Tax=Bradyrhizobium sp. 930_D9_N1_4 TaxID=3240374 RepID=UPI003F89C283
MTSGLCLLTAYDSVQQPLAAFTVPRMQAFAQAHGYECRVVHGDDWKRPRGWLKVEVIQAALEDDFDFILWMDVDAVVLRNDVDIRTAAVDGADLHMAWHGPDTSEIMAADFVPHFNSGIMLIRTTDWSRAFFTRVWETGQLRHPWFDQATILHALGYDGCLGLGPDRPDEPNRSRLAHLDTAWNSIPGLATAPDPIVHHYAGISNPSTRLRMIEADAMTAALREHAGAELRQAFARLFSPWREDANMRDWVTTERDSAMAERYALQAETHAAQARLKAVQDSTSWKLTAPLRWTKELFSDR